MEEPPDNTLTVPISRESSRSLPLSADSAIKAPELAQEVSPEIRHLFSNLSNSSTSSTTTSTAGAAGRGSASGGGAAPSGLPKGSGSSSSSSSSSVPGAPSSSSSVPGAPSSSSDGLRRRAVAGATAGQKQAVGAGLTAPATDGLGNGVVDQQGAGGAASAGAAGKDGKANGEAAAGEAVGKVQGGEGEAGAAVTKKARRTASSPVHMELRDSPLSSTSIFKQSHAGLVNLCVVILVAVNSRLIIENLLKYGILIGDNFWIVMAAWRDWPLAVCGVTLAVFPLNALLIEWLHLHSKLPDKSIVALHALNIAVELLYPSIVIYSLDGVQPLGGFNLIFVTVVMMMKLISYAHVNHDLRQKLRKGDSVEECAVGDIPRKYPQNLTLPNMLYFMAAPTLCYQLSYPRTSEIRKPFLVRQVVLMLSFLCLMIIIIEQYITPIIRNSKHPFTGHLVESIERVLRLSIPTLYVWLCMFFAFFHLWLNILAELLKFGDRDFYRDWWNAKTIEEYWRLWNMPVHRWMARHIFFPFINMGMSKGLSMFIVFFLSAVFHEVLIGIPCRMLRLWAFSAMFFQIPLVHFTNYLYNKYKNPIVGNMLFWFFFCIVGQPACILLYYHDVQLQMRK